MSPHIYIIHGWGGYPGEGWFPWLKNELEAKGYEVTVPALPNSANPRIENWIPALQSVVGMPTAETYFVGHSMGCQAIARYLETLPADVMVGGAVFVAGFFKRLTGLEEDPEVQAMDRHWLETPLDFSKVTPHLPRNVAIFSDNDPYVPLDNQDDFRDKLGSEIIIEHGMGHFSQSTGTFELLVALDAVLNIVKQ